MNQLIST